MDTIFDTLTKNADVVDQRNMTGKYNTQLTPAQEAKFRQQFKEKDSYDYDMRGAFKAGITKSGNGHFPDTYKKPNHPTFSDESIYHGVDGNIGGSWGQENGKDTFTPSETNLRNMTPTELQDYFQNVEPDVILKLPQAVE